MILFFKAVKKPKAKDEEVGISPDYLEKPGDGGTAEQQLDEESGSQAEKVPDGFGPHNVEVGHHVAFQAGEFKGSGKVQKCGEDGCTVSDKTGREHRVHWSEVSGHHPKPE